MRVFYGCMGVWVDGMGVRREVSRVLLVRRSVNVDMAGKGISMYGMVWVSSDPMYATGRLNAVSVSVVF